MSFNDFENGLLRYMDKGYIDYIQSCNIGVIGCGGLGSNILNALVRLGFKNFVITDFDKVDISNLNRQLYTMEDIDEYKTFAITRYLKKINKDLNICSHNFKIEKADIKNIFKNCDSVFEAVDNATIKRDIYIELSKENKTLIFGNGLAGIDIIGSSPIEIKKIKDNIYIVGDNKSEVTSTTAPYAPKVITVSSIMAGVLFDLKYKEYLAKGDSK